jgi:predicted AAA+ superfamily ATPase
MTVTHWADEMHLRDEVVQRHGHAYGLQMSLYEAVYQTTDVPYREAAYWCDITEPTTKLVEFMAEITRHLGSGGGASQLLGGDRLFHLDQGMGGGKSHALVGLWHLATHREEFFASETGQEVLAVASQRSGSTVELGEIRTVVLCADNFSPGVARPEFGPAVNLHQRFLWALFDGDRTLYDAHVGAGADKAALKDALVAAGRPVLILLDEVMDYAMALAGPAHRETIPDEQAFLNALTGVVAEVSGVILVTVMIRSDLDEQGYEGAAQEFRSYLAQRLERNGTTVSVNEPQDFGAIIRRRIFARPQGALPIAALTKRWKEAATSAWREHVFDRLPGARQLGGFEERLARSYPFHPDLLDLVEHDWTQHAGFQRVRSTVAVFSASAYWWSTEHESGRWAPELIGVGDIPLHEAADKVLSSGGRERRDICRPV